AVEWRKGRVILKPGEKYEMKQEAVEDGCLTLRCELSKPGQAVEWRRDAQLLKDGEKYQTKQEGRAAEMLIRTVTLADAGEYSCCVANKFGVTSYNGNITIMKTVQPVPAVQTPIHPPLAELIKNKAKSGQSCYLLEDAFSVVSCLPWRSDNLHRVSLIENYPAPLTALGEPVRQVRRKDSHFFLGF
uniref:Ig-like domain-containing protein n=1 Tax=Xiphophorus maculatus TaxID=8083 RepID=A0A3B5PUA3_XIPMA